MQSAGKVKNPRYCKFAISRFCVQTPLRRILLVLSLGSLWRSGPRFIIAQIPRSGATEVRWLSYSGRSLSVGVVSRDFGAPLHGNNEHLCRSLLPASPPPLGGRERNKTDDSYGPWLSVPGRTDDVRADVSVECVLSTASPSIVARPHPGHSLFAISSAPDSCFRFA